MCAQWFRLLRASPRSAGPPVRRRILRYGVCEPGGVAGSGSAHTADLAVPSQTARWKAQAMASIFICYRRDDTSGHAGRLYDRLREQFGDDVFMDIGGIGPGVDYVELIEETISSIEVLLVLIGRDWLDVRDSAGRRRLESPNDLIREEISQALARDVLVIPVLVQDATLPTADELPPDLAGLARRNAIELSDERWSYDADRLGEAIVVALRPGPQPIGRPSADHPEPRPHPTTPERPRSHFITYGLVAIGAAALALVVFLLTRDGGTPETAGDTSVSTIGSTSGLEVDTTEPGASVELSIEVESGVLEPPMAVFEDPTASGGFYVSSATRERGSVTLGPFEVPAGLYVIEACARPLGSNPAASDSVFVRSDADPNRYWWDFFEDTPGLPDEWSCEVISARCGGTFDSHNCDPLQFDWDAGEHTITFETLEADFGLDRLTLLPRPG